MCIYVYIYIYMYIRIYSSAYATSCAEEMCTGPRCPYAVCRASRPSPDYITLKTSTYKKYKEVYHVVYSMFKTSTYIEVFTLKTILHVYIYIYIYKCPSAVCR